MTLYFGNNEVSQKVLLNTTGSNLPEITAETSGKILSNNGTELEWVDNPNTKIIGSFGYTLDEVAPDGCVFCNGSEYEKAKFPDFYQSLVDNKRKSVDYATFNSSVSTNGSCGFFGLDTENEKFKVPMLKDVYLKAGQEPVIFGGESLPNITGTAATDAFTLNNLEPTGAFYKADMSYLGRASETNTQPNGLGFNASLSSPTYQDGAKVNPDYVAYKVFVVIYNAETEISESQTSEFLNTVNEINNKLDNEKTNCITKISQDIKLELNNGTLTLKAGSKVYVPNGVGVFDEVVVDIDKTFSPTNNSQDLLFIKANGNPSWYNINLCFSGNTQPTFSGNNAMWYDTGNNLIKETNNGGSSWTEGVSFPVAQVTDNGTIATSIDQVFNGFGYIGSTIFALPSVECIIPNGRNADGSLNNIKFKITEVKTATAASNSYPVTLTIYTNGNINTPNAVNTINDEENNYFYTGSTKEQSMSFGSAYVDSGRITLFSPKITFQAIDRNDTEWASTASKPSNVTQNLTLEASGSEFTVPSNGWFFCNVTVTSDELNANYLALENKTSYISIKDVTIAQSLVLGHNLYIPCKSGDVIKVTYSGNLQGDNFTRFIYDEGSK